MQDCIGNGQTIDHCEKNLGPAKKNANNMESNPRRGLFDKFLA